MSKFENNAITWFEVPTTDIERAARFYETLLDEPLPAYAGEEPCHMFPMQPGGVGGCLVQREKQRPVVDGTTVYLNVDGKLDATLKRAERLGAKVFVPRTAIPGGYGYYACVQDSEGNRIGLHSRMF